MRVHLAVLVAVTTAFSCAVRPADARVLEVGPSRALTTPSAAAAVARDGDTVRIDAGDYRDCAVWRASDLTIEGAGDSTRIRDAICLRQAIWLFLGNRVTVRRVAIDGAHTIYGNGSGLKFTGRTLTVDGVAFHDNENGLLVRGDHESEIRILNSVFEGNGRCLKVCAHGVYVGEVGTLRIRDSIFRGQRVGHHIKSRALFTEIASNRIEDGEDGTASYSIDLPNAGTAFILRNRIEKGPRSENSSTAIAIGEEGNLNAGNGIYVMGNEFHNDNPSTRAFVRVYAAGLHVEVKDNHFEGFPVSPLESGLLQP
jgi:hypothetical protein